MERGIEGPDLDGRVYVVIATLTDMAGNISTIKTNIVVPHDERIGPSMVVAAFQRLWIKWVRQTQRNFAGSVRKQGPVLLAPASRRRDAGSPTPAGCERDR